jgi:hypothetical protein
LGEVDSQKETTHSINKKLLCAWYFLQSRFMISKPRAREKLFSITFLFQFQIINRKQECVGKQAKEIQA